MYYCLVQLNKKYVNSINLIDNQIYNQHYNRWVVTRYLRQNWLSNSLYYMCIQHTVLDVMSICIVYILIVDCSVCILLCSLSRGGFGAHEGGYIIIALESNECTALQLAKRFKVCKSTNHNIYNRGGAFDITAKQRNKCPAHLILKHILAYHYE